MSVPAELALGGSPSRREAALWGAAGLVVLAAHGAFALAFNRATLFVPPPAAVEQAMEVELAPLPVSLPEAVGAEMMAEPVPTERIEPAEDQPPVEQAEPETIEQAEPEAIQPVDPEMAMAEPVEPEPQAVPPEPIVEPDPPAAVEAEQPPDTLQPEPDRVEPEPVERASAEPEIIEQIVPEAIEPEVAVPLPSPKPVLKPVEDEPQPRVAEKPQPKKAEKPQPKKKVESARPKKSVEEARPKKPAEPRTAARTEKPAKPRSQASSASSRASKASKAPQVNPARWHNAVRAAVARRVGRVRGGQGTVNISFVVNSSGAVVSARVSRSSGNGRLDSAAVNAVRSARVPAPPAGIGGSTHAFSIPVTFD